MGNLTADLNHDLGTKTNLDDSSRVKGLMMPNLLPGGHKYSSNKLRILVEITSKLCLMNRLALNLCYRSNRCLACQKPMSQWQLKKHIIQILTSKNGNSITKTRRRFLKEEKENKKKDFTDLESSPRVSRQNRFESASFGTLSTWANEAAVRNNCVIVTYSFSETKGFFCFSFNDRSPKDAAWKTEGCLHT